MRRHRRHIDPPDVAAAKSTHQLEAELRIHQLLTANLSMGLSSSSPPQNNCGCDRVLAQLPRISVGGRVDAKGHESHREDFAYLPRRMDTEKLHIHCQWGSWPSTPSIHAAHGFQ
jgi:hypothetical protein